MDNETVFGSSHGTQWHCFLTGAPPNPFEARQSNKKGEVCPYYGPFILTFR